MRPFMHQTLRLATRAVSDTAAPIASQHASCDNTLPVQKYAHVAASVAESGFAVVPDFLTPDECDAAIAHAAAMTHKRLLAEQQAITVFRSASENRGAAFLNTGDKTHFFYEDGAYDARTRTLRPSIDARLAFSKIGHAMHDLDPFFERFCYRNAFARVLRAIGYAAPRLVMSQYIFKNPRVGGEIIAHKDNTYLATRPLSAVGFWLALHDAHIENGCLWGVPESHRTPATHFMRRTPDGRDTHYVGTPQSYDKWNAIPLEVQRGSLIVMAGDFVHWSASNKSDSPRHAVAMHFVEGGPEYFWHPNNWLQRGAHLPFRDYYKTAEMIDRGTCRQ